MDQITEHWAVGDEIYSRLPECNANNEQRPEHLLLLWFLHVRTSLETLEALHRLGFLETHLADSEEAATELLNQAVSNITPWVTDLIQCSLLT